MNSAVTDLRHFARVDNEIAGIESRVELLKVEVCMGRKVEGRDDGPAQFVVQKFLHANEGGGMRVSMC